MKKKELFFKVAKEISLLSCKWDQAETPEERAEIKKQITEAKKKALTDIEPEEMESKVMSLMRKLCENYRIDEIEAMTKSPYRI